MRKRILGLICIAFWTLNLEAQELKEAVCIVKHELNNTEKELYEQTAKNLRDNGYFSSGRTIQKRIKSFGSGFLHKANNGKTYLITNKHVVENAKYVELEFNNISIKRYDIWRF